MKIIKYFSIMFLLLLTITGCSKDESKIINVTFYDYDGTIIGEGFVESLDEVEMPDISRKGYTLKEWIKTEEENNISYKANYEPNKYKLKFTTDGVIIPNLEVTYNEIIKLPIPEKPKYDFLYWTYEGKELNQEFLYDYDQDIRIVAEYKHEDAFLVEYKDPDGSLYKKMYVLNLVQASCDEPVKEGHTFVKWVKTVEDDKVIFTAEFTTNTYNIYFASNSNYTYEIYTFKYGTSLEALPVPTKENYTFMGWFYNNEKLEVPYVLEIPHDVTIYAKWEKTNFSNVSYQEFINFINNTDKLIKNANQFKIASNVSYSISTVVDDIRVSTSSSSNYDYKIDYQNDYYEKKVSEFRNNGFEIYRKVNDGIYLDSLTDYNGTYYLESKFISKLNDFEYKILIFNNNFKENESFRKIDNNHYLAYTTLETLSYDEFDLKELADQLEVNVNDLGQLGIELEISVINNEVFYKAIIRDFTFVFNDMVFKININITHEFNEFNAPITQFNYNQENVKNPAATKISEIKETTDLSKQIQGFTTPNPHYYRVEFQKGLYSLDYSTFEPDDIIILNKDLETYQFSEIWYADQIYNGRVFYIESPGTYYLKIVKPDISRYNFKITKQNYQTIAFIDKPINISNNNTVQFEGSNDLAYYSFNSDKDGTLTIDTNGKHMFIYSKGQSNFWNFVPFDGKYYVPIEKGYNLLVFTSETIETINFSISYD